MGIFIPPKNCGSRVCARNLSISIVSCTEEGKWKPIRAFPLNRVSFVDRIFDILGSLDSIMGQGDDASSIFDAKLHQ